MVMGGNNKPAMPAPMAMNGISGSMPGMGMTGMRPPGYDPFGGIGNISGINSNTARGPPMQQYGGQAGRGSQQQQQQQQQSQQRRNY